MDLYARGIFESVTEKYTHIKSSIAKKMESSFPPALGLNLLHPEGRDRSTVFLNSSAKFCGQRYILGKRIRELEGSFLSYNPHL